MFTRFAAAVGIASVGDQVFLVVLPWLVLELTGSGFALGTVLTLAALPRAGLMLLGGAVSDRFETRRVLLATYATRAALMAAIASLIGAGLAQAWHLYPFAVLFGAVDAFAQPAASGMTPRLVDRARLARANSVIVAQSQTIAAATSIPAGALIAFWGMSPTLALGAIGSAVAALLLTTIRLLPAAGAVASSDAGPEASSRPAIPVGIRPVLRAAWRDPGMRGFLLVMAMSSLATAGPLAVGLPALAQQRFGGSVALGVLMSASGLGGLAGTLIAGRIDRLRGRGVKLLIVNGLVAGCLLALNAVTTLAQAATVVAVMSIASGFVGVVASTSLQGGVDRAVLGRVMSLVMLASVGLAPLSFLLAGVAFDVRPGWVFPAAGLLVLVVTGWASGIRALRTLD